MWLQAVATEHPLIFRERSRSCCRFISDPNTKAVVRKQAAFFTLQSNAPSLVLFLGKTQHNLHQASHFFLSWRLATLRDRGWSTHRTNSREERGQSGCWGECRDPNIGETKEHDSRRTRISCYPAPRGQRSLFPGQQH